MNACRPSPVSRWAYSSTYVANGNRAKGVGRALLSFAAGQAKSAGLSHIEGFVLIHNEPVIRIIESLGWQRVGVVPEAESESSREALYVYAVGS